MKIKLFKKVVNQDTGRKFGLHSLRHTAVLFAIFGIIRYRTDPIPIKEMTYLFLVIGISVVNALSNKKISHAELVFANLLIVFVTFGMERIWLLRHETIKNVIYEKIELIVPERREELIADLKKRTGIDIIRIEIRRIDFLKDVANIRIFYYFHSFEWVKNII